MMQRRVGIAGVGVTRHRAFLAEKTWKDLVVDAAYEALGDCGLAPGDLEAGVVAYLGELTTETGNIGPIVADAVGMAPAGVTGISGACSGGAMALYHACALVGSGLCDVALAVGFEKGGDLYEYVETICPSSDSEYDYSLGLTHLDWLALMSRRYGGKHGVEVEAMVRWVEDRHRAARQHPKSFYYGQPMLSREAFQRNLMFLASARADGAAAAIVTHAEADLPLAKPPVWVEGLAYASSSVYLPHKFHHASYREEADMGDSELTRLAWSRAAGMAGLDDAWSADLLQVSDGAPGIAFMELEALGLYPAGEAWKGVMEGNHSPGGRLPTNTHGGSIAFGHASGAAALVNVVESVTQMRGEAGERQVDGPIETALCQSSGGSNSNNAVVILRSESR